MSRVPFSHLTPNECFQLSDKMCSLGGTHFRLPLLLLVTRFQPLYSNPKIPLHDLPIVEVINPEG